MESSEVAQIVMVPVLDDFGEVTAASLPNAGFRLAEATLDELARITNAGIAVYASDSLIPRRPSRRTWYLPAMGNGQPPLGAVSSSSRAARLRWIYLFTLCAFKPLSELFAAQEKLTRIGQTEAASWSSG
jgi:hypothetical protein